RVTQRALRQHALDGLLEHASREALLQLREVGFTDTTRISGVMVVLLVERLVAGHAKLVDVDHDDVVAGIDVRRIDRLVLATQTTGNLSRKTAKHLVGRIDNKPVALDFMRLGRKRFHSIPRFLSGPATGHETESRRYYGTKDCDVNALARARAGKKNAVRIPDCVESTPKEEGGGDIDWIASYT